MTVNHKHHPETDTTVLLLAGGQGKRMGGVDKGLQLFQNKPMIQHIIDEIKPYTAPIFINANRHLKTYQKFGYPVYQDDIPGYPGPLAGFLTGLNHCRTPFMATIPCDAPLIRYDIIHRLRTSLIESDADIAVALTAEKNGYKMQSVFTVMKRTVTDSLAEYMNRGNHKIATWFDSQKTVSVPFNDDRWFKNINTLEDLKD